MIRIRVNGVVPKPEQHDTVAQFVGEIDVNACRTLARILPEKEFYTMLGGQFFYAITDAIDKL